MPSNTPFGFTPSRHLTGGVIRANEYRIASAYGTSIFKGDPVKLINDGTIQLAAAGDRILGIFQGVQWVATDGSVQFNERWIASTTLQTGSVARAMVVDDPNVLFEVQSGGTPALTNVGNLADHVAGTGSTVTGMSGAYLDSTMGTGAAGFRIRSIVDKPGNSGIYSLLEVQIFEHEFAEHSQATPGV